MVRTLDGSYLPRADCDGCGEPVAAAREANYELRLAPGGEPATGDLFVVHKLCSRAFRAARGGEAAWAWGPLEALPQLLLEELRVEPRDAREAARFVRSAGLSPFEPDDDL